VTRAFDHLNHASIMPLCAPSPLLFCVDCIENQTMKHSMLDGRELVINISMCSQLEIGRRAVAFSINCYVRAKLDNK
jgi:hypothetical protein